MGNNTNFLIPLDMKVFFSPKVVLGLVLLLSIASFTNAKEGNQHRRMKDVATDVHKNDPKENAKTDTKADAKGSFTTSDGKKIEHEQLYYLKPKPSDPSKCDKDRQIKSLTGNANMPLCPNYHDMKWDGFMMDPKEQAKAYPDLAKFNEKYYQHFQGKNIETNPMFSSEPYPKYVYEIGLCQSKFWSQNLINNKIIYNSQATDYEDIQYSICAKYDVLGRSCMIGSANPDKAKNPCYNFYRLQSAKAGQYTSMDIRRLGIDQDYDDTYKIDMLNGSVQKKKRNGKYTQRAASKIQKEAKWKEQCLKHIYEAAECKLWRNMIPAAFQREIMQMTSLHKTIAVDGQSGESIKEGVTCDTEVIKPVTDAIAQDVKLRSQLIATMRGPSGDLNANKEGKSNLLVVFSSVLLMLLAIYN